MPVILVVVAVMVLSLAVVLPAALLVQAGADWIGDRIEAARPGDDRARWARYWIRLLVPVLVSLGMIIVIVLVIVQRLTQSS